jgi:predicted nucleic acid-binding protein
MTRFLFDANVVLDVLLDRTAHVAGSSAAWALVENKATEGFLSAHAITTIYYLIRTVKGHAVAMRAIGAILKVFHVAAVDQSVIVDAVGLGWADFEDAVSAVAGEAAGCTAIVTRDATGFRRSTLQILTPETATSLLTQTLPKHRPRTQ